MQRCTFPKLTVGIPTCNRIVPLLALLHSLEKQTFQAFSVIIADDGDLFTLTDYIVKRFSKLQIHFVKGQRINLPVNRQTLLDRCMTEWMLMCDDDHILDPHCIEYMWQTSQRSRSCGIVSAVWPDSHAEVIDYGKVRDQDDYRLDLEGITERSTYWWHRGRVFFNWHKPQRVLSAQFAGGGCVLYRKEAVVRAGGFPTWYSFLAFREDTDISHRIYLSGYKVSIDTRAVAYHTRYSSGGVRDIKQAECFRKRDGKLFLRNLVLWRQAVKHGDSIASTCPIIHKKAYRTSAFCSRPKEQFTFPAYYESIVQLLVENHIEAAYVAIRKCAQRFPHNERIKEFASVKKLFQKSVVYAADMWLLDETIRHRLTSSEKKRALCVAKALVQSAPRSLYGVGLYIALGDLIPQEAQYYYRCAATCLEKIPYRSKRETYRLASLFKKCGEDARALQYFHELVLCRNTDLKSGALYHSATLYHKKGASDTAYRLLQQCVRSNPQHRAAMRMLEDIRSTQRKTL